MDSIYIIKEENEDITIGDIVAKDYRKADIFKAYGIDFCCGGKRSLSQVCKKHGVNIENLKKDLEAIDRQPIMPSQDFYSWNLDFLCDYIVNTHHRYVVKAMPLIFEYTQKVERAHGNTQPEVIEIANNFIKIMEELNSHMMKEEKILFPYIKNMALAKENETKPELSHFSTVQNPIDMMELEHEEVGKLLNDIKQLSNNYTPPVGACTTYRISYLKLKEFENDLHQHIHIENNILFPRAIELERELFLI